MGLREGGVFVVFPEILKGVLNSWESATRDREREVKLSGAKPQSSALCQGREQASKYCREIPTLGGRKEEERLLGGQEAGRPPPWRS